MAIYAIQRKTGDIFTMEAMHYEISEGFVRLYLEADDLVEEFASFNCDGVVSIIKQNEYTTEEILEQIAGP